MEDFDKKQKEINFVENIVKTNSINIVMTEVENSLVNKIKSYIYIEERFLVQHDIDSVFKYCLVLKNLNFQDKACELLKELGNILMQFSEPLYNYWYVKSFDLKWFYLPLEFHTVVARKERRSQIYVGCIKEYTNHYMVDWSYDEYNKEFNFNWTTVAVFKDWISDYIKSTNTIHNEQNKTFDYDIYCSENIDDIMMEYMNNGEKVLYL